MHIPSAVQAVGPPDEDSIHPNEKQFRISLQRHLELKVNAFYRIVQEIFQITETCHVSS